MISLTVPVPNGTFTDAFGPRGFVPGVGNVGFHTGRDIAAPAGTPIYAAHSGIVTRKWWDAFADGSGAGGWMVEIDHGDGIYISRYAHMSEPSPLIVGGRVIEGQTIVGYVGSSGAANGPHLHHEVLEYGRYVNPDPLYAINQGAALSPSPAPVPTPEERDEEMANVYLSAEGNSYASPGNKPRITAGVIKDGGVTWSNVWERSENGTIRRLHNEEWIALNQARANADLKTPVTGISGTALEQMVFGKRIESRE